MVGDVETGPFEQEASAAGDDSFDFAFTNRAGVQRFIYNRLIFFELMTAFVTSINIGRHTINTPGEFSLMQTLPRAVSSTCPRDNEIAASLRHERLRSSQ